MDNPGNEHFEAIHAELQAVPTPLEAIGSGTSEAPLRSAAVDNPSQEHLEVIRAQLQAVQTQLEALGQRTGGVLDVAGLEALEREASELSGQLSDLLVGAFPKSWFKRQGVEWGKRPAFSIAPTDQLYSKNGASTSPERSLRARTCQPL